MFRVFRERWERKAHLRITTVNHDTLERATGLGFARVGDPLFAYFSGIRTHLAVNRPPTLRKVREGWGTLFL